MRHGSVRMAYTFRRYEARAESEPVPPATVGRTVLMGGGGAGGTSGNQVARIDYPHTIEPLFYRPLILDDVFMFFFG